MRIGRQNKRYPVNILQAGVLSLLHGPENIFAQADNFS